MKDLSKKNNKLEKNGIVLFERGIIKTPIITNLQLLGLYCYLRLSAEYKPISFYFGYKKIDLGAGQKLIKQSVLADMLNIPKGSIKRCLEILQSEGLIIINKTTNKYTMITVTNYEINFKNYKQSDEQKENKVTNKVGTVSTNSSKLPQTPPNSLGEIVEHYNSVFGKNISSTKGFERNFEYWLPIHGLEKIKLAITNMRADSFGQKLDLAVLFRQHDARGEDVDWIERFANSGGGGISDRGKVIPTADKLEKYKQLTKEQQK